jgi:hypothetical protein
MVKPIRPEVVAKLKKKVIPDEVFKVWNDLIVENFDGESAVILYRDAKKKLESTLNEAGKPFKNSYMNIEFIYVTHGWTVTFDEPAYNESYSSSYEFRPRTKAR